MGHVRTSKRLLGAIEPRERVHESTCKKCVLSLKRFALRSLLGVKNHQRLDLTLRRNASNGVLKL
jgi:hypothetical protein